MRKVKVRVIMGIRLIRMLTQFFVGWGYGGGKIMIWSIGDF
jgi:hypothetical protein